MRPGAVFPNQIVVGDFAGAGFDLEIVDAGKRVVEDDEVLREAFTEALEHDPAMKVLGSFASAEEYLNSPVAAIPDVVIMDLNLPGMDGIACTERLKRATPTVQVLVCTVQDDDDSLFNALCAGATGYLLKDARPTEVQLRMKPSQNSFPLEGTMAGWATVVAATSTKRTAVCSVLMNRG